MVTADQHSRRPVRASNRVGLRPWRALAEACREVRALGEQGEVVRRILELSLEATGAERAFVVSGIARAGRPREARIEASVSLRDDGRAEPSRTVIERALWEKRIVICTDARNDHRFGDGRSVRGLGLRIAFAAPMTGLPHARTALVLDGRSGEPPPVAELEQLIDAFAALLALAHDGRRIDRERQAGPEPWTGELVGDAPVFVDLLEQTRTVAGWDLPVLVVGESGTGKEGIVRTLHERSRRPGPLVALNCAAVPETLLEVELFGAVRGAYTGLDRERRGLIRLAEGGTLLLDEIGDMAPSMQAKLLRVLQEARVRPVGGEHENPVDVRVVAATHRDLPAGVARGLFRADLYYRLAMVVLRVPPLRARREDIPLLVRHLGARLARRTGQRNVRCTPAALRALRDYRWPGNVRELEAVLAGALVRSRGGPILPGHLELADEPCARDDDARRVPLERQMVETALRRSGGVLTEAAARIGWSRQKLLRRMTALGVERTVGREG